MDDFDQAKIEATKKLVSDRIQELALEAKNGTQSPTQAASSRPYAFNGSIGFAKNNGLLDANVESRSLHMARPFDLHKDAIVSGVRESIRKAELRR